MEVALTVNWGWHDLFKHGIIETVSSFMSDEFCKYEKFHKNLLQTCRTIIIIMIEV